MVASTLRTLAPFMRTARVVMRSPTTSPLVALQRQAAKPSPVTTFCRNYAVYQRDKPHVNIGTALAPSKSGILNISITSSKANLTFLYCRHHWPR